MTTINQLLESVETTRSAVREYAAHDAEREEALAEANHQVAIARQTIAELSKKLKDATQPSAPPAGSPPVITISHTTRMAGLPIYVHAMDTPGIDQHSDIRWNFGDGTAAFNDLSGFNAAHVYDLPGTYTLSLSVNGRVVTQQVLIIPAVVNRIIRLHDARSDCRNVLTAPVIELPSTFWPKISNATIEGMAGSGTKLTYTGRQPNASVISLPDECDDLLLRRLTFDSAIDQGATRAVGVYQQKASLAVIDCIALRLESFIKSESKSASGLLIQGCSAPLADGVSGYFAWVSCNDAVIVGNTVANVTREHVVRMGYYDRVLIAQNDFTNLDRRQIDKDDFSKGCIVAQRGRHVWIAHNHCRLGGIGIGPLGGPDGLSDKGGVTRFAVVEKNTIEGGNAIVVSHGTEHARIEQNTVDRGKADLSAIEVAGVDPLYPDRKSRDLSILDNRQRRPTGNLEGITPVVRIGKGVLDVHEEGNIVVASGGSRQ
ncbi:MAG: PKD domain-containing protein [Phycisphaerales bacterium]|nr:PKD domain-containing protein [Phycisphaerales bacterium]